MTFVITLTEARRPGSDIFLFKEPSFNLATQNRFVVSNIPHMPPATERVYAYYPPVYPFVFGLYGKLAGSTAGASLLFEGLLRVLRAFLLFLLLKRFLGRRELSVASVAILAISTLASSDADRPDELSLVWGLGALLGFLSGSSPFVTGALLGLCGATSPTGGLFFGLLLGVVAMGDRTALIQWVKGGLFSILVFALCVLPLWLSDDTVFARFLRQAPLSTFGYLKPEHGTTGLRGFFEDMQHYFRWGRAYLIFLGALLGILVVTWESLTTSVKKVAVLCLIFAVLSPVVWSLQPYYLWFPLPILLVCTLFVVESRQRPIPVFVALVAMSPLVLPEMARAVASLQRNPEESIESIRAEIVQRVEVGARVAATPVHYFVLKGTRETASLKYNCFSLERYSYILLPPDSNRRDRPAVPENPCHGVSGCYQFEADLTHPKVFTILGIETPYFVPGYGGYLFRRTCP